MINLIRRRLDGTNGNGRPGQDFKPGDTLRITDGPFQGMLAIFDRPTTPAERVQVLLNILGRANRAWIPATDVEKIRPQAKAPAPKWPRGTRGHGRGIKNRRDKC